MDSAGAAIKSIAIEQRKIRPAALQVSCMVIIGAVFAARIVA
jgi:hypothetical protein